MFLWDSSYWVPAFAGCGFQRLCRFKGLKLRLCIRFFWGFSRVTFSRKDSKARKKRYSSNFMSVLNLAMISSSLAQKRESAKISVRLCASLQPKNMVYFALSVYSSNRMDYIYYFLQQPMRYLNGAWCLKFVPTNSIGQKTDPWRWEYRHEWPK